MKWKIPLACSVSLPSQVPYIISSNKFTAVHKIHSCELVQGVENWESLTSCNLFAIQRSKVKLQPTCYFMCLSNIRNIYSRQITVVRCMCLLCQIRSKILIIEVKRGFNVYSYWCPNTVVKWRVNCFYLSSSGRFQMY